MKPKPYPRTLPPLPKGQVYLGKGGSFDIPKGGSFQGYTFSPGDDSNWEKGIWLGKTGCFHFCAPANSEVARLNGLAPAKKQSTTGQRIAKARKAAKKASKKGKAALVKYLDNINTTGNPFDSEKPTPALVLEVGKTYLTRGGQQARVLCVDLASEHHPVVAAIKTGDNEDVYGFTASGQISFSSGEDEDDIISLAPDFDWSCLPPWINYIAMDEIGIWYGFEKKPVIMPRTWEVMEAYRIACGIPPQYAPTNQPYDWRESLRVRPGYNPNNSTK